MQWNFAMLASYATGNAGPVASWRSENVHEILGVKFEALAAIIVLDDPIARLEMASADYRRLLLIPARSALPKRP
jgi:hypothetical protein